MIDAPLPGVYSGGMFKQLITWACAAAVVAPAWCADWMADFEAAQAKAKEAKKPLLVDFTGSDWCSACKALERDVLNKPEFLSYAKEQFVLVKVDVPMNAKMDPALKKKNQDLVKKYSIPGYPTLLVMTPKGEVAGGFVGAKSSPDAVKPILDKAAGNARALAKAHRLKGSDEEQARALYDVYQAMGREVRPCAAALHAEIRQKDPQDTLHLVGGEQDVASQAQELEARTGEKMFSMTGQQILDIVKEFEPKIYPENRLSLLQVKMTGLLFAAESVDDMNKARDILLKDAESLPEMKDEVMEQIRHQFADPAGTLKKMQEFKAQQQH